MRIYLLLYRESERMHIISKTTSRKFWLKHPDSEGPLRAWFTVAKRSTWTKFVDVRKAYPSADDVGGLSVFDIGGNKYRLIVKIEYRRGQIFVLDVLTHAQYSRGHWKQ